MVSKLQDRPQVPRKIIDELELLERFGEDTILDFFHVDNKPNEENNCCKGIAELKDAIAKVAMSLPEMGRTVPKKWQQVREILQTNANPYLSYKDVMGICQEQGIDKSQAELFICISHELGHLIHYDDSKLKNIVILKPDWLAKAISFVLDDPATRKNNGLVNFEDLSKLWSNPPFEGEKGYSRELHEVFLRLMERFELSYKIVLERPEHSNTSLIAQLVPDNRPTEFPDWQEIPNPGEKQQVQICRIVDDRGQFAEAEGLFYRLIVRLHKYSLGRENYKNSIHWQRGLMLDDDFNGRALLEYINTDIRITVRAAYPEFYLYELTKEVKSLIDLFWEGLRCEVMVPCIQPCGKNKPGTGLFEVQKLIESKRQGMPKFPCMISGCNQWLNIDDLMRNAPPSRDKTLENIIREEFGDLTTKIDALSLQMRQGFQDLDQNDRRILSQANEKFAILMQMLTDEAKDGPRLFSIEPVDRSRFNLKEWTSEKFRITLWCEHKRVPLTVLNGEGDTHGVYEIDLKRDWVKKASPILRIISLTLKLALPIAIPGTKLETNDEEYKAISEQLEFGVKSADSFLKGSEKVGDWIIEGDAVDVDPSWENTGEFIRAEGSVLRELHAFLKEKDPSFGGLIRVQNPRREFLWVHPKFKVEY